MLVHPDFHELKIINNACINQDQYLLHQNHENITSSSSTPSIHLGDSSTGAAGFRIVRLYKKSIVAMWELYGTA